MTSPGYLTDDEYRYVYSRVPRLCIDLAIVTPEGFILTRRDIPPAVGLWHTPGGRVRYRESIDDAVERIAATELGITVALGELLGFMEFPQDGEFVHSVSLTFLAKQTSGIIRGSEQASVVKSWKEIPEDTHPVHKKFYRRVWKKIEAGMI